MAVRQNSFALSSRHAQFSSGLLSQSIRSASVGWAKARSAVSTKVFREALVSRYRRLKIEGGAFFLTLALADRGSDLLICAGERTRGHDASRLCPPYACS